MSRLRIGSILGTQMYIEMSFLILVVLFVAIDLERGAPIREALLWVPTAFLGVLVHELGHAAAIGMLGFGPSEIVLAGFGGFTLNRRRARPFQDLLIGLAGPLASLLLAIVAYVSYRSVPFAQTEPLLNAWLPHFANVNIIWAIFNIVPIHPLDGGQVFQHFLRLFASDKLAFVTSVWLSIILAAALAVWGLVSRGGLFLTLICALMVRENYQRWAAYKSATSESHENDKPME